MKADFEGSGEAEVSASEASTSEKGGVAPLGQMSAEANNRYDGLLRKALKTIIDEDPDLLESTGDYYSHRLTLSTFTDHLQRMVEEVDARDHGKVPLRALADWCGISSTTTRAILSRHALIVRAQPVRAALDLQDRRSPLRALVIKVFAGRHNTTMVRRGIHRAKPTARAGRQMHLELIAVTADDRPMLVGTERFAVRDVTWKEMRAAGELAVATARESGIADPALLNSRYEEAIIAYQLESWGEHVSGRPPRTVPAHVSALLDGAMDAAKLIGAPELYQDVPVIGGQLVATTRAGTLPAEVQASLVSHDLVAIERLVEVGVLPALDLNAAQGATHMAMSEIPFAIKLSGPGGLELACSGEELLSRVSDVSRSEGVPPEDLRLGSPGKLAVRYLDGEIDLPAGPSAVRIFYRAGLAVPHGLYLVLMVPGDERTHQRALDAIVLDSTVLHTGPDAPMRAVRQVCEVKGAFDPGGERADTAEGLATVGRLAAGRKLHRMFAVPPPGG
jgi:hypothetical protein